MKLFIHGTDLASEENLSCVKQEALRRGHELGPQADICLTGLSSVPDSELELSLGIEAVRNGIPWFVLADTHRSWARPWAKRKVGNANVIVASPLEKEEAVDFGFKNAHYFGGPPSWRDFLSLQPVSLERKSPDEKLILVPACKEANVADHIAREVIAACKDVFGDKWKFIFKPHPKERSETANAARRAEILKDAPLLETNEPTNRLIASVDCSIFNPGAVGTTIAGLLRKPSICFRDEVTNRNLRELTGSEEWYPADHGACISADALNIREMLLRACSKEGAGELAEKQMEVYPSVSPDSPRPEAQILDFLESRLFRR